MTAKSTEALASFMKKQINEKVAKKSLIEQSIFTAQDDKDGEDGDKEKDKDIEKLINDCNNQLLLRDKDIENVRLDSKLDLKEKDLLIKELELKLKDKDLEIMILKNKLL